MPIKKIAKELGISIQTSFDWRHKILSLLSQFTPEQLIDEIVNLQQKKWTINCEI